MKTYNSKIHAYSSDCECDTFYIGSKKANTRIFLRIYDKKKEQLSKKNLDIMRQ